MRSFANVAALRATVLAACGGGGTPDTGGGGGASWHRTTVGDSAPAGVDANLGSVLAEAETARPRRLRSPQGL